MKVTEMFLTPNKYSRPGTKLIKVRKIAIHYVGNPGTTAISNRNYFNNLKNQIGTRKIYGSSHYIIGLNGEIIQCLPLNEISYATNSANSYSISIENCHPDSTGKFNTTTEKSLIELCSYLCKKYKLNPITDLIRHYDVNGKICPKYYVNNPSEWRMFKNKVKSKMNEKTVKGVINFKDGLNIRSNKDYKPEHIIGWVPNKGLVQVLSKDNTWANIKYKATTGYVSAKYITLI